MYETAVTMTKALGLRGSVARTAKGPLLAALLTVGMVVPTLAANLVLAPPAHAATTTPYIVVNSTHDFDDTNPGDGVCDFSAGSDEPCSLRAAIQVGAVASATGSSTSSMPSGTRLTLHENAEGARMELGSSRRTT